MSEFDSKFLKVYEDGSYEKPHIPTIWNQISSTPLFRTKLAGTAELGVTLCSTRFSWEMCADDLEDQGIQKLDITSFLKPFAEESPDFTTLLTSAQNLNALFNFKLPLIDVIGLIRSCVFRVPITSYREPSELFQSTCHAKSFFANSFSLSNVLDIAIKECKNFSFGSFKGEFTPLVKSSTRLDWFAGFWSEYKPSETTETNEEEIEVVTDSKYFLLSFIEKENKSNEDNEAGHPDFLKVITQMRLILSQTARGSVVSKVRNFHNCICCHAILSSRDQVVILTMKPSLSKTDDNISIDYLLYLSGIYNMKEKNDRLMLCNFLITSAYIASSITKLICANLLSEIAHQSTFPSIQKGSPKRRLQTGNLLYCKNQNNRFAIKIEKEIGNGVDKPLYEGTIVGTEDECIIKIYNNNRDSGYKLWHLRLQCSELTGYNEDTHFDIPCSDISYKGTPLEGYLDTNKDVDKTTLMIQLLVQLYDLHQMEILHNDIKPENIIVYQDYPYFIDFEACKKYARYDEEKEICFDSDNRAIQSSSGTSAYNPPEKDRITTNHITPKSDIYSLGLVFAKLLNFSLQTKDIKSNFERLKETNDETVCNLIEKMISNDIKTRPSTQQCLDSLGVSQSQYENFSTPIIEKQLPNLNLQNFKQLLESKKRERMGTNLQEEREQKKVKH